MISPKILEKWNKNRAFLINNKLKFSKMALFNKVFQCSKLEY